MVADNVIVALLLLSLATIVYHHLGYPVLLRYLARARRTSQEQARTTLNAVIQRSVLPSITLVVPAYNEAAVVAGKIENIARLDYPRDRLLVVIALDGCTDATRAIALEAIARHGEGLDIRVYEYPTNIGKIGVLNDRISHTGRDIVALSDASALIEPDALRKAAWHFGDDSVGVVCATYRLASAGSEGERAYWAYQTRVKADEAALAAPMGAHGAFYLFRRSLWRSVPADTINDDFFLPMQIVLGGSRAVYDPTIVATESERTIPGQEFHRRVRIGAGNMQQTVRLARLGDPRRGWLAFLFLSGKGLRPIIPFLAILAMLATAWLALRWGGWLVVLLAAEVMTVALAAAIIASRPPALPRILKWLGYIFEGHLAMLIGAVRFLTGMDKRPWGTAKDSIAAVQVFPDETYVPTAVAHGKRLVDIVLALMALPVLAIVYIPIAIAIKLESPGPVFYRQQRVGRAMRNGTHTFDLVKLRSMRADAESGTGAVWAVPNDPRVTRVGRFLRSTRLDELPQIINVLKGDMSVVGPRPERPVIVTKLEAAIPFYSERTYGVRPGITGLAQVNLQYDSSISDVRAKIAYDHAYAAQLGSVSNWLATDLRVLAKTVLVVVRAEGH